MHEQHDHWAHLLTMQEQTAAIALYPRFGFQLPPEQKPVAFDEGLREQRYDWLLAA